MKRFVGAVVAIAVSCLAAPAPAQDSGLLRLSDREDLLGWEAVGRLDFNGQGYCTGTLIAPDLVLTAAHCVYDRSGRLRAPKDIVFRAGLRDGVAIAERTALQIAADPQYLRSRGLDVSNVSHDVALVRLSAPIGSNLADAFVLHSGQGYGSEISVTSYGRGRDAAPSRQRSCQLMQEYQEIMMIDCNVTFGSSGAPVFSQVGNRGRILGLVSGGGTYRGRAVAFAMKLPQRVSELKAQLRRNPVQAPRSEIRRLSVGSGSSSSGAKFVRPGG